MKRENPEWLAQRNSDWLSGRSSVAQGDPILIAEDSQTDVFFLLRAFAQAKVTNSIYVVHSGADALSYLKGIGKFHDRTRFPLPKIVLLDLRMPSPDGFEILEWKCDQPELEHVLFVALSNFDSTRAIKRAYQAGAATFLSKPLNAADIKNLIESFEQYWSVAKGNSAPKMRVHEI